MSDAKLKKKIRQLFKSHLEPKGFLLSRPRIPERKTVGLRQGIEFQPGCGHLSGKYTLNVYWSFMHSLDVGVSMNACKRIGFLAGNEDRWFSRTDSDLDADFEIVENLVLLVVLPHLERYATISKIMAACETGELTEVEAFGIDAGWRHFNQGFCHASLGNIDAAIHHYREVVASHSDDPYAWVQQRRLSANELLTQLRA